MRTTIIPAQITTVEDKIAGNLNFTQLLLLMTPVIVALFLYAFVYPFMRFTSLKLVISTVAALIAVILAVRIKGKVVLEWVIVYCRFALRPAYYVFDKNDLYLRDLVEPVPAKTMTRKAVHPIQITKPGPAIPTHRAFELEQLLSDKSLEVSLVPAKEGTLHVAYKEICR